MKKRLVGFTIVGLVAIAGTGNTNGDPCRSFVLTGLENDYANCSDKLRSLINKPNERSPQWFDQQDVRDEFLKNVAAGKSKYMSIAFDLLPLLDGAAAEETSISLGRAIPHAPLIFLIQLRDHIKNIERLDVLLGNLGDEYVDKLNESTVELKKRLQAIQNVDDPSLIQIKKTVVEEFNSQLAENADSEQKQSEISEFDMIVSSQLVEKKVIHGPEFLLDSDRSTAWCEGSPSNGVGEWIQVDLKGSAAAEYVDRISLGILPGYVKTSSLYTANARPAKIRLKILDTINSREIGNSRSQTFKIEDKPVFQLFQIPIKKRIILSKIRIIIIIEDVFNGSKYNDMCITDLNINYIKN